MSETKNGVERVEKWLEEYGSKSTRKTYRSVVRNYFLTLFGKYDNETVEAYFTEEKSIEKYQEDIIEFQKTIQDKPAESVKLRLNTIRTFLSENDKEFTQKFWRKRKLRVKGSNSATADRAPTIVELRQIFNQFDIKGRALYFALVSSGMRIGECLQLKLGDLDLGGQFGNKIRIQAKYTKSGEWRDTWISEEAVVALNEWLKVRKDYLKTAANRIKGKRAIKTVDGKIVKGKELTKNKDDDRIFPYGLSTAYSMWEKALDAVGLDGRDENTNRRVLHPHSLRKFYRTRLGAPAPNVPERVPIDIVYLFMGQWGYLGKEYVKLRDNPKLLSQHYEVAEPFLTVYGDLEKVGELKKEVDKSKQQLQDIVNEQHTKNLRLENEIAELKVKEADFETATKEIDLLKQQLVQLAEAGPKVERLEEQVKLLQDESVGGTKGLFTEIIKKSVQYSKELGGDTEDERDEALLFLLKKMFEEEFKQREKDKK